MDKHIETLNIMESSYAHVRKSDSEFEAIEAAKEALQEQAEREKGCEYCENVPSKYKGITAEAFEQRAADDEYVVGIDVNYCPKCGRELK